MAAPIKMDELLVSWLGSDEVYDNVMALIEKYRVQSEVKQGEEKDFDADSTTTIEGGDTTAVTANIGGDRSNGGRQQQHGGVVAQRTTTEACGSLTSSSGHGSEEVGSNNTSHAAAVIPPFHPLKTPTGTTIQRRRRLPRQSESWEPLPESKDNDLATRSTAAASTTSSFGNKTNLNAAKPSRMKINSNGEVASLSGPGGDGRTPASLEDLEEQQLQLQQEEAVVKLCVRDQLMNLLRELHLLPPLPFDIDDDHGRSDLPPLSEITIPPEAFLRICKEVFLFPTFFHQPLYQRILDLWNKRHDIQAQQRLNMSMLEWYWKLEMEPYDPPERFFRLVKQPNNDCILRDDFLPFIKALLNDHPGLEFLSNHAEFQEKYAVTVITRIFYSVNKCHSGRITSRQVRRSDLVDAFNMVDEEEDINKVTRYFSYEHFYVLYCRFWELDHDRDYRITREDLLKYGDHSLSHMIVDRIFDAAPRPFEEEKVDRDFLSYEDFIYFMLSEEDKSNDVSVRYWFNCVDVDGDSKLNNMEMRSFYAVQLHRMQCMGHEIVPFEDMLCQMMDMIKPKNNDHLIVEDFLQPACSQVSGALFDALFNLNKYLMFEQRDPFVERQKREDEFDSDWDRFACIDYNRLAMEEEAREEEAMEIDWVTVDEDEEGSEEFDGAVSSEAPF